MFSHKSSIRVETNFGPRYYIIVRETESRREKNTVIMVIMALYLIYLIFYFKEMIVINQIVGVIGFSNLLLQID